MILRPNANMGDPNASRRQMMAQLLQGGPMPASAPNPGTAGLSQGMQSLMQRPDVLKWFQTLLPRTSGPMQAPPMLPPSPATGKIPGPV